MIAVAGATEASRPGRLSVQLGSKRPDGVGALLVESGCGAVAVGSACLFPPLSSGGASIAEP
jgi:hypothetical protein